MTKNNEYLLEALITKLNGEVKISEANIQVYLDNPAGIGDHPDIIGAIEVEIEKIATAQEKMSVAKLMLVGFIE